VADQTVMLANSAGVAEIGQHSKTKTNLWIRNYQRNIVRLLKIQSY